MLREVLAATALALGVSQAQALPIHSPVPSDAFITFGGLEWAWGGPCPYSGGCSGTGDLSYQSTLGWSLPTASELASAPDATAFLFPGANVPAGGTDPISGASVGIGGPLTSDMACAAAYFDTADAWCDFADGVGQIDAGFAGIWAGAPGSYSWSEQLYVRSKIAPTPEPTTLILVGSGIAGLALRRRGKIAKA